MAISSPNQKNSFVGYQKFIFEVVSSKNNKLIIFQSLIADQQRLVAQNAVNHSQMACT